MSILNYFGGKSVLAPWIIQHFPTHSHYWDLFGGGGSVLLAKEKSDTEAYCDAYNPVVNFFQCLKFDTIRLIKEVEFLKSFQTCELLLKDPASVEHWETPALRAAQFYIYSRLSFSGAGTRWSTGKSPSTDLEDIDTFCLWGAAERMRGVEIHHGSCLELLPSIPKSPECFICADPPYVMSSRKSKDNRHKDQQKSIARRQYAHEFTDDDHRQLIAMLEGRSAVISGFDNKLYQEMIPSDWRSVSKRVGNELEMLWISPQAWKGIPQRSLFDLLEVAV